MLTQLGVGPAHVLHLHVLPLGHGGHDPLHVVMGQETQGVQHQIGDLIVAVHEQDDLVVLLGPAAVEQFVLVLHLGGDQLAVLPWE